MRDGAEHSNTRNEALTVWTGVLLPAFVWGLQMQINYVLVRTACSAQRNVALYIVTILALMLTIGSGLFTLNRKRSQANRPPQDPQRGTFIWSLALLSSGMFSLVIVAQAIPALLFNPCQL